MRVQSVVPVVSVREVARNIHVLTFSAPAIAQHVLPGQFVNIRIDASADPLLRRPFSVYRTQGDTVEIIFNVVGRGTSILSSRRQGDMIDVLGPLGVPFGIDREDFSTALLVAGGLGVAPMPIMTDALRRKGKKVVTFLGARTADQLVDAHLQDPRVATDDASRGRGGTVVELLEQWLTEETVTNPKIFACGPNAMLRALGEFALRHDLPCEVSLEGAMGCGFGICQGCPVELVGGGNKYALMCTDGPTFDVRRIRIPA